MKNRTIQLQICKRTTRAIRQLAILPLHKMRKAFCFNPNHSIVVNSYDMTILHEDELENVNLAMHRRLKKKIPTWANHDQLELAIIDQTYFQTIRPEDIFGSICLDHAKEWINSLILDQ